MVSITSRFMLTALLLWANAYAWAGSIGFSISFTGPDIALTHVGSEPAFQLTLYTLDASTRWRKLDIKAGDLAFVRPGSRLQVRRSVEPPDNALGAADPLLVLFRDQTGNDFSQLAWRQTRPAARHPLPIARRGAQLQILPAPAPSDQPVLSYAIVVPYAGIARLGQPYRDQPIPPDPVRHDALSGLPLTLDSGAGQAGAWLLHQYAPGDVQVQIVPEGHVRGTEQQPAWLTWARAQLMPLAAGLSGLGVILLLTAGWLKRRLSLLAGT